MESCTPALCAIKEGAGMGGVGDRSLGLSAGLPAAPSAALPRRECGNGACAEIRVWMSPWLEELIRVHIEKISHRLVF